MPDVGDEAFGGAPAGPPHTLLLSALAQRHDAALLVWITAALRDGYRVLVGHAPEDGPALRRLLRRSVADEAPPRSERIVLADAARLGARTGGRAELLAEFHAGHLRQALADGYAGLAVTGDGAALRACTAGDDELAAYERGFARLAAEGPVRALCRYHPARDATLLADQLAIHRHDVDDDGWGATGSGNRWWIRGEVDADNADRLYHVLCAAIDDGLAVVDLSALDFCGVAGLRALRDVADSLPRGRELLAVGVTPLVARIFTVTGPEQHPRLRLVRRKDER